MKPKHVIGIVANLLLIAALSGCGVDASTVETASSSTAPVPATKRLALSVEDSKGDGSFKVYEYY